MHQLILHHVTKGHKGELSDNSQYSFGSVRVLSVGGRDVRDVPGHL